MLPYTPAQFTARSLKVAKGHCVYCNAPTERDSTNRPRQSGGV